jgi:ATP-dependent RNA circularization protein (DNA/RNA ligase family)
MTEFVRFPHTPHLAWLGSEAPRDDKLLSSDQMTALLSADIVVEEKLDGANLGLLVDDHGELRLQNRGQYLVPPSGGQFSKLPSWVACHRYDLVPALGANLILFGEWCAARHSVAYDRLPDWFVAFDVYDRAEARFWSTRRRNELAKDLGMVIVPQLFQGRTTLAELTSLVQNNVSRFAAGNLEGVVVRRENTDFLEARAKLVRPDFIQAIGEHWRNRPIEWNAITM